MFKKNFYLIAASSLLISISCKDEKRQMRLFAEKSLNTKIEFASQERMSRNTEIIWIIDDSESMEPYQTNVADNFETIIDLFDDAGEDGPFYKLAVTTTNPNHWGLFRKADASSLSSFKLDSSIHEKEFIIESFTLNSQVGILGSAQETGLQATAQSIWSCLHDDTSQNFLYISDSSVVPVIIVSDSNDKSSPEFRSMAIGYINELNRTRTSQFFLFAIIDTESEDPSIKGTHYISAINQVGGKAYDINDDFSDIFADISTFFINSLTILFPLKEKPHNNQVMVYVNEILTDTGWDLVYCSDNIASIKFRQGHIPAEGSILKFVYEYEPD